MLYKKPKTFIGGSVPYVDKVSKMCISIGECIIRSSIIHMNNHTCS